MTTFKQAYTQWCAIPENTALGAKTKIAVDKVLLSVCSDMDVTLIDRHYVESLLKGSKVKDHKLRVNAISILGHVLTWLHNEKDKKVYSLPDFNINIVSAIESAQEVQVSIPIDKCVESPSLPVSNKKELQTRISSIKLFRDELLSIANSSDEYWQPLAGSDENKAHFDKVNNKLEEISTVTGEIKALVTKLTNAITDLGKIAVELREKENSMAEEFARIKRELNSETINPDTFLTLSKILTDAKQKLTEIGKQEELKKKLNANLNKALDELNEAWRQEYLALEKEVAKVNAANGNLTIDVEFKGRRTAFVNHLKGFLKGTGLRDATYQTIESKYKDYIEIVRDWKKFKNSISDSVIGEVSRRLKENLADLLTYKVENKVTIKYKGKALTRHSLGQRASALILFLLAQKDTNVLIIDQPEDDLDNQTIYEEVITEIVNLKSQMQFIFATHNANIPVLGESEKVVACDFEDGTNIALKDGSIDTPDIQKAIVSIMEGGEIAFNKRREIYNIWRLS